MSPLPPSPTPPTARGVATRAAIVHAARTIFERDGFIDARITDITALAGTATGSFYRYFQSKEALFGAVTQELNAEMHHPPSLHELAPGDPDVPGRIARNHRAYLEAYRRNARLMSVVEQVTNISDAYRRQRTAAAQDGMAANAAAIRRLQDAGRADPAIDPLIAARALSVMVSRAAYVTFVLEEETDVDALAATLTQLWVNALRIEAQ